MKGLENLSLRSVEGPERANRRIYGSEKDKKLPGLLIYSYLKRRCIYSSENGCRVLNWYVKGVPFGISILNIKTCE